MNDYSTDCGYNKKFEYNIYINATGINGKCISYAAGMCQHKWGWWFNDDKMAYMSFEDPTEMTLWALACYHKQHRE
jgi:hypothetical protein